MKPATSAGVAAFAVALAVALALAFASARSAWSLAVGASRLQAATATRAAELARTSKTLIGDSFRRAPMPAGGFRFNRSVPPPAQQLQESKTPGHEGVWPGVLASRSEG